MTEEMAEKTGLAAGTPICGGAGDTMQSMLGSGNMGAGQAVDVAGTCSMFCVSTKGIIPELSKKGAGLIFNSGTLPDTYFYWGYIRTGGLALRWFKDSVCGQEKDGDYFDVLNDAAKDIPAGSDGVLFLPYLTGGTNDVKEATGCFLNMTLDTDQATLWHAVLEAIGYDYMEITDLYRGAGVDMSRHHHHRRRQPQRNLEPDEIRYAGQRSHYIEECRRRCGDRLYRRCLCTGTYH